MREQVELQFVVGVPDQPLEMEAFEVGVADSLSRFCGGCTIHTARGYWREDGAEHKQIFDGKFVRESTIVISLTCEQDKVEPAYSFARRSIAVWADWYELPVKWVHVKKISFVGMHFDASEEKSLTVSGARLYRDIVSPGTQSARR